METVQEKPTKAPPPYFAFRTLLNTLDTMKEKGVPNRVDRTFLVGMSGAGQTQFIAGLKSLGLIDPAGNVTTVLIAMAQASPSERKTLLANVLQERYPEAVELGKTNATTGQLMEVFNEYGVTGDTARKAIAFYLQAARYAGDIPLSPLFQTPKVTSGTGTRKKKPGSLGASENNGGEDEERDTPAIKRLHPALAGVLSELPRQGRGWTAQRRDAFMATFAAVANFTIPVIEEDEDEETDEEAVEDENLTL